MENLNNYVVTVCFVIIFCVVIEAFSPSEKYVSIIKVVSGFFVIYTLISPIKNICNLNFYDFGTSDYNAVSYGEYENYEKKTLEVFKNSVCESMKRNIEADIIKKFNEETVSVTIDKDNFSVTVFGTINSKRHEISEYIKNNYGVAPHFAE